MYNPIYFIQAIQSLNHDWQQAHQPSSLFINTHKKRFKRISLGCSFSVEQLNDQATHNRVPAPTPQQVASFLTYTHITHIRFGLQWKHVFTKEKISLAYYKPYLDMLLQQNMPICLNIGPIKTMRWPEHHVPQAVLDRLSSIPPTGSEITPESELAKHAQDYLYHVLYLLKKEYGKKLETMTWQPDNEPFDQAGITNWRMNERLVAQEIEAIESVFPGVGYLINSAVVPGYTSTPSLIHTMAFVEHLISTSPQFQDRLTIGADYYYHHPYSQRFPFSHTIADTNTVVQMQYPDIFDTLRTHAQQYGYRTEITELQCEPWGSDFPLPGNSVHGLQFALFRSLDYLDNQKKSLIRIWGVEQLLLNWLYNKGKEINEQITLIRAINEGMDLVIS